MPELPDVEGLRETLDAAALRRRIKSATISDKRIIKGLAASTFRSKVKGRTIKSSHRHGKNLFARLDNGAAIVMHFGMTGGLAALNEGDDEPKFTRVLLRFENGSSLACTSRRMLGGVSYTSSIDDYIAEHDLGPDALTISKSAFIEALRDRKTPIKSALMDQSALAGIGNEYADEILFQARIHPAISVIELDERALNDVYRVMGRVLKVASDHGGRVSELPRGYLQKVRGTDEACPKCGGAMKKMTIGGRTTYFCPNCQARS